MDGVRDYGSGAPPNPIGEPSEREVMPSTTHGTFDDLLASAKPALRPVCVSLRREILALDRNCTAIIWPKQKIASFGIGPRKMSDHFAYIAVYAAHVNLGFYHGTALTDRAAVLKGSGKKLRHISFRDVASTKTPAIAALLRQAIADRRRNVRSANARPGRRQPAAGP